MLAIISLTAPKRVIWIMVDRLGLLNISIIHDDLDSAFLANALRQMTTRSGALIVADDAEFLPQLEGQTRLDFGQAKLDSVPINLAGVTQNVLDAARTQGSRWHCQTKRA